MNIFARVFAPRPNFWTQDRNEAEDLHDALYQDWVAFAADVNPDGSRSLEIVKAPTPWKCGIDFSRIDVNDKFIVETAVAVDDPDAPVDAVAFKWHLCETYVVGLGRPDSHKPPQLMIDDEPLSPFRVLTIEPPTGPWAARLTIAQINGITRPLRYIMY